jgi:hypothetical protein
MAPFTIRLIPASNIGGMQFIARSSHGHEAVEIIGK